MCSFSLRDRAQVEQLLHYIVEEPPEDADSKRAFKYVVLLLLNRNKYLHDPFSLIVLCKVASRYLIFSPSHSRFPFVACEVFTCEIDVILKTLVEEEEVCPSILTDINLKYLDIC